MAGLYNTVVLKPFLTLTLAMKGDGPTVCMVITQYTAELQAILEEKMDKTTSKNSIYPILEKMLAKTQ